jgi:predicted dehydrogenase
MKFAVIGVAHPHATNITAGLLAAGAGCAGYWPGPGAVPAASGFAARFPELPTVDDPGRLLDDPAVALVVTADIPDRRARVAVEAMRAGKDVLAAKPGCLTAAELADIRAAAQDNARIWTVAFSERLHVRSAVRAGEIVRAGRIGRVVQTIGLGPHRLNRPSRPDWFFDPRRAGGILTDLASHQIDQFLHFTGSSEVDVTASTVANHAHPDLPGFADFGEVLLRGDGGHGYARVDWYTPDGLPTWGDGRLTVLGTEGYLEIRKYADLDGRPGGDHLFVVDGSRVERVDCADVALPFYPDLLRDIAERTDRAMPHGHAFQVTELAIRAESAAIRAGHLA